MSQEEFQVPAKPWTEDKLKFMKAHAELLPDDVRVELGMTPLNAEAATEQTQEVATPSATTQEQTPESTETVDETTQAPQEPVVDNEGAQTA